MADDPVDMKPELEKECHSACKKFWEEYEACSERVHKVRRGNCAPFFMDYYSCIDKCAAPKIFSKLK
eukprot:CAMPEP_0184656260 /NCGR_PEP_ID=MMETSP0308-20130426/16134_1 /TAXON_ID=38269 /ORGANISM="Gloeochaete witrockiana, Strain SAG 46.84" /LENGTH=66 /DNA_ID=CAMNT_0027093291 /DNA_START=76 /DNA_END=276 /DNA_ORIENTATION=-